MISLLFDSKNPYWEDNADVNLGFILHIENHLNSLVNTRGYIYLNQIYEALGFAWDPKMNNKCWIKPNNFIGVNFECFRYANNSILIWISE